MNVYLSMAKTNEMDALIPPYCLLVLASVAENAGHRVSIVFPSQLDAFLKHPENLRGCEVFGLSANSFNWDRTKQAIRRIHSIDPGITVVLGGAHPTFFHEHCLETTEAQIAVRQEGEVSFPAVLQALASKFSLSAVKGISYKHSDGRIAINEPQPLLSENGLARLPLPAYEKIPAGLYDFVPMETSRGCLFNCIFCGIPFPRSFRRHSPERIEQVLSLLNRLTDRFRKKGIFISDDSFSADRSHCIRVLDLVRRINPEFSIGCEARITELLRYDLLKHLEMVRIFLLQVGVECGYKEGLRKIRKRLTLSEVVQFADACVSTRFHYVLYWSFVIGFPWETSKHVLRTIDFAFECATRSRSQPPQLNNFAPYPGSEIVERYDRYEMPPIRPEFFDDPSWFQDFLRFAQITSRDRLEIFRYLERRNAEHLSRPWAPRSGADLGGTAVQPGHT